MWRAAPTRHRLAVFLGVGVAVLAVDQLTKALALAYLPFREPVSLFGTPLRLSLVHNTGSAFGLVQAGWVLVLVGVVCCVIIPAAVLLRPSPRQFQATLLAVIWGGSLGNLVDRLRTGGVTDFVDLRVWPVFNMADIAVTMGCLALVIGLVMRR